MATDKNIGNAICEYFPDARIVAGRCSSDVGDPDGKSAAVEEQVFGKAVLQWFVVDVAKDGTERFELFEGISHLGAANITCMPDFVALPEMIEYFWV